MKAINIPVSEELHNELKVSCCLSGETIKERVIRLVTKDLEERKTNKK